MCGSSSNLQDVFDKNKANALSEKIALLKINGTIDGKKVCKMAPLLKRIKEDSDVKCVVVRVNSPGGTIDASETLLQEVNIHCGADCLSWVISLVDNRAKPFVLLH